jgi:hypothetical protein
MLSLLAQMRAELSADAGVSSYRIALTNKGLQ